MDHKAFLASLPAAQMAALTTRSDAHGVIHLVLHLGLIFLTGALIAFRVPFWGLLLPLQGILLVFLFTLQHECTHQTPFRSTLLNEAAGHVAGALIFNPFLWFRYFHLAHHRHTNIPGKDPELDGPKPDSRMAFVRLVSGIPLWIGAVRQILSNAAGRTEAAYLPPRILPRIRREARILLAVYALVLASLLVSPLLLWVWLVPMVLGQPFLRLYLMAEHGRCPQVANMFDNTRTTFTNRAVRALAWNMPYHVEHHVAPNVPFHHLPEFHTLTLAHLKQTEHGYATFTAKWIVDL